MGNNSLPRRVLATSIALGALTGACGGLIALYIPAAAAVLITVFMVEKFYDQYVAVARWLTRSREENNKSCQKS